MPFLTARATARATALAAVVSLVLAPSSLSATSGPAPFRADAGGTSQRRDERKAEKLDSAARQDGQLLVQAVDASMTGQEQASGIPMTWLSHFLKGREGRTYVPYVIAVENGKLTAPAVAVYVRVVPRGMTVPAAGDATGRDARKTEGDGENVYPFEDIHFIDVRTPPAGQPYRISRALAVPPGEYDVYVALRERGGSPGSAKAASEAPRTGVMKQPLAVPDFWTGDLTTSSIIMVDRIDALAVPVPPELQADRPYAFGPSEVVPALDTHFRKSEELSVIFYIYNPALGAGKKPSLTVEYGIQRTDKNGLVRKTPQQDFNAETLPAQFDASAGHQIGAGQSVPLASFADGEYRLEIVVKDHASGKTVTRELTFSVSS